MRISAHSVPFGFSDNARALDIRSDQQRARIRRMEAKRLQIERAVANDGAGDELKFARLCRQLSDINGQIADMKLDLASIERLMRACAFAAA